MKASKILHVIIIALGVAAVVLGALERLPYPKVAMGAGAALAVVGVVRMGLAAMDKAAVGIFALLLLGHALYGCATTSSIVKDCRPATTDETQAVTSLFADLTLTNAEKVATLEGGKILLCVVSEIARDVVDKASTLAFSTPPSAMGHAFEEPPMVVAARAWLAKHP